jgi:hypothetical protein
MRAVVDDEKDPDAFVITQKSSVLLLLLLVPMIFSNSWPCLDLNSTRRGKFPTLLSK